MAASPSTRPLRPCETFALARWVFRHAAMYELVGDVPPDDQRVPAVLALVRRLERERLLDQIVVEPDRERLRLDSEQLRQLGEVARRVLREREPLDRIAASTLED